MGRDRLRCNMLTACSPDFPDIPGTSRDSHQWRRGKCSFQLAILALESTARNGSRMTHTKPFTSKLTLWW
jgi:hypothetical protein